MNPMRSQRGVAMVTVLLIGAALTAVTSVGTFATIREFGAGDDDRDAANALAVAEAGIDRFLTYLKSGQITYGLMNQAGCGKPALSLPLGRVGPGTFRVSLTVYNPLASGAAQFPPAACTGRPTNPNKGQTGFETTKSSFFVIESEGEVPEATRVVRQVIAMQPIGLPVGIYARSITVQSAQHDFLTVSMISETTIQKRANLSFEGDDPWYLLGDLFPGGVTGRGSDWSRQAAPAAAHAAGTIYLGNSSPAEFASGPKNCTANQGSKPAPDGPSKSLWDSDGSPGSGTITSGCDGQTGWPNSSKFTTEQLATFATPRLSEQDYQSLKDAAKTTGLYCSFPGQGGTGDTICIKRGVDTGGNDDYAGHIQNLGAAPPGGAGMNNLLTYFEFRSGTATQNNLGKTGSWWSCNDDPDLSRSIVVIVRNGGVDYTGAQGDQINGAFVMDGNWSSSGNFTFNGSLIAQGNIHFHSSAQNYQLDACWVKNTPGPFMRVVPDAWTEVDR